jgi:hypothetical protein
MTYNAQLQLAWEAAATTRNTHPSRQLRNAALVHRYQLRTEIATQWRLDMASTTITTIR